MYNQVCANNCSKTNAENIRRAVEVFNQTMEAAAKLGYKVQWGVASRGSLKVGDTIFSQVNLQGIYLEV